MNIIKSISLLILFFGLIILTIYLTRSYTLNENFVKKRKSIKDLYNQEKLKRPTTVFKKMFTDSSVWMGFTDSDVKNAPDNLTYYDQFNTKKYSNIDN